MMEHVKQYFDENRLLYALLVTLFAANIIVFFAIVRPGGKDIETLRMEYFSLRKAVTGASEELKNKENALLQITAAAEDMDAFVAELPLQRDMTSIITEIRGLAKKAGLDISAAKYTRTGFKDDDIVAYDISFPINGTYRQVRKFIYSLEKLPYLMSFDELTITSNKLKTVSLPLKVSIYFRKVS